MKYLHYIEIINLCQLENVLKPEMTMVKSNNYNFILVDIVNWLINNPLWTFRLYTWIMILNVQLCVQSCIYEVLSWSLHNLRWEFSIKHSYVNTRYLYIWELMISGKFYTQYKQRYETHMLTLVHDVRANSTIWISNPLTAFGRI